MIPVLSRAQMRAFDATAIERCYVPGLVLMENAGRGAADVIARDVLRGRVHHARVVVVCGTGNNGGDGFVIGRRLLLLGAQVEVFLVGLAEQVSGDARANLDALLGVGGTVLEIAEDLGPLGAALASANVVVDALFGTGLTRDIAGVHAEVIARINATRGCKVAVDIPSGLDADTGRVLGSAVIADHTVTFAHHKLGLLTPNGARHTGELHLADIGVPTSIATELSAQLLERRDIVGWLEPRAVVAYKNTAGHVAVLAGSSGKIGAALMVARACLRAGAGLATITTWPESAPAIESRVLEAMTARLDPGDLTASLDHALAGKRVVVVGPGFGLDERARTAVTHVLETFQGPVVVDADALTLFTKNAEGFTVAKKAVLTPHPGELARILGTSVGAVEGDRFAAARAAAEKTRAVVLLKGVHTLIATPDGRIAINPTGNAALATAGAGDVLSGILGALAGILEPFEAACTAAYVHGMAADIWRAEGADRGLLASEIADLLPRVFGPLVAEHTPWPV